MAKQTKLTNWRATLNRDYIAAPDLDAGNGLYLELQLIIKDVVLESVKDPMGQAQTCKVARFYNTGIKPLILNNGHCEQIEAFCKKEHGKSARYIENWGGCSIQLHVISDQMAFGQVMDRVFIRAYQPRSREKLTPDHPKWDGAVKSVKRDGKDAIVVVQGYFDMADDVLTLLKSNIS